MKRRSKKNKKTGAVIDYDFVIYRKLTKDGHEDFTPDHEEDWEDYEPSKPFFSKEIRDAIRAWWDIQDNPLKCASVCCVNDKKDKDGYYNYEVFGYIQDGENKVATRMDFRTKRFYKYDSYKDYTREELCGSEE